MIQPKGLIGLPTMPIQHGFLKSPADPQQGSVEDQPAQNVEQILKKKREKLASDKGIAIDPNAAV